MTHRGRTARGVRTVVWAVIVGVPAEADAGGVLEALESWQRWPAWQARVRPGASLNVRRRKAADASDVEIPWADLAPEEKRIQVIVPGPVYASIARAARADGLSLRAWCRGQLAAAAGVVLEAIDAGDAPPAFVDVPLPLGLGE